MGIPSLQSGEAAPAGAAASAPKSGRRRIGFGILRDGGVPMAFIAMLIAFSIAKPEVFPTLDNAANILDQAAVLGIVAAGLTVVLVMGQFDLSFGATVGLAGSAAVALMGGGMNWVLAIVCALGIGGIVGLVNGVIVTYGRVPAFIGTLAVSSAVIGVERSFTNDETHFDGIATAYTDISRADVFGITVPTLIAVAAIGLMWILLDRTVFGRRTYAIGSSEPAARLAGIRTERTVLMGFVIVGLCAGLAGIIVTSQASSSFPNSGTGLLLPAYAAAFLGASAMRRARFHPAATFFGVVFLGSLSMGLIQLDSPSWTNDLMQGAVLGGALLLARRK